MSGKGQGDEQSSLGVLIPAGGGGVGSIGQQMLPYARRCLGCPDSEYLTAVSEGLALAMGVVRVLGQSFTAEYLNQRSNRTNPPKMSTSPMALSVCES